MLDGEVVRVMEYRQILCTLGLSASCVGRDILVVADIVSNDAVLYCGGHLGLNLTSVAEAFVRENGTRIWQ